MRSHLLVGFLSGLVIGLFTAESFAGPLDLDSIAGVYKERFANSDMSGDKYTSENILEIVKVSPTSAYFRTHLEFFNGHLCAMSGVADVQNDALVYHGGVNFQGQSCTLRLRILRDKITFEDENLACRVQSCGERGGYGGISFPSEKRRPIRYMQRLLASREYADAIKDYEALASMPR